MPNKPESSHWLDEPRNVKRLRRGFIVVLAAVVIAEAFVHMHPAFAIERVFGFNAWFGLLSCLVMIGVAKALAVLLRRPDTYYDGTHDD